MTDYNLNIVIDQEMNYEAPAWFNSTLQSRQLLNNQVHFFATRVIGHGAHSKVFELVGHNGRRFAGKISDRQLGRKEDRRQAFEELCKEATFLKLLTDAKYNYSPRFCLFSQIYGIEPIIVMELMGPNLGHLVDNPEVLKMRDNSIAVAIRDMLFALNGMHELGFCVQDVKLENFCVVRTEDDWSVHVKLVDFGMTVGFKWAELRECDFQTEEVKSNSAICGTLPYIPRAGYVDTLVAPLDDLESLFYQLMRIFGQKFKWFKKRYHESYRQKVKFWTTPSTTYQTDIVHSWFVLIRDSRRSSHVSYELLILQLTQTIHRLDNNNKISSEIVPIKKLQ
ncbi:Casein kinase I isoform gamma-1 [Aphelenchoides besseyi]|nr:Casein kinase I isoform gamma-1 [Aphelenchoides besseyi]